MKQFLAGCATGVTVGGITGLLVGMYKVYCIPGVRDAVIVATSDEVAKLRESLGSDYRSSRT